jgi:hypothetical protein
LRDLDRNGGGAVDLQPFERGKKTLLAAPLAVAANVQAVIELFDKRDGAAFTTSDQHLLQAASVFGTDLLRQALAQRQTHQVLLDAVAAALGASESVSQSLAHRTVRPEEPAPPAILDQLREGLRTTGSTAADSRNSVELAEAIRVLAVRHGAPAVQHCIRLVESLRQLLDEIAGA